MKKQKTAIDWLVNVVQSCISPNYIPKEIIKKAKEMEKEQIMNAWVNGVISEGDITAEKYYNKTYKNK